MAYTMHNPTFKRPEGQPPQRFRSISPPRSFVEPLSPAKPTPIEPNFNYPALDNPAEFAARPESAYAATPRARTYSTSHKSAHNRTPSTIDALAEVALATSPSYPSHSRKTSVNFDLGSYNHAQPQAHPYSNSEPPHKRARSEHVLPAPQVGLHSSRPATSYESNGWMQPSQGFNSRVEEAALLLNFQSGGWPNHAPGMNAPPIPGPRPHANSFPQDVFQQRPTETLVPPQPTLLPPFKPQDANPSQAMLPSPTVAHEAIAPQSVSDAHVDVEMKDMNQQMPTPAEVVHAETAVVSDPSESGAASAATASREISEAPKGRRGWPKGKPRGPGGRKSLTDKVSSKKTSRKKMPDTRANRGKSESAAAPQPDVPQARRKSLSDLKVVEEQRNETELSATTRASSVPRDIPMIIRDASPSKNVRRKGALRPETICAGCETSRESNKAHSEFDEWISCNGCKKWYHIDCAGFKKASDIRDVDKYFCTSCEPTHGKTTYVRKSTRAHASVDYAELQRGVLKTSEESMEHHYIQPIKDGAFQFDPEYFPRMRPELITREFFEKSGTFTEPICIPAEWNPRPWKKREDENAEASPYAEPGARDDHNEELYPDDFEYDTVPDHGQDKLDMVMPEGLTVRQVCNLVGPEWPIDVIDVKTQNSGAKWNLSRWADYYEEVSDEKAIRNVISLEVSQTKLGRLLQRPKVVRDIDLQDDVWPQEEIDKGKYPKVQFYCLMSIADSYTDFHIDFGGSSVYYHILKGKKTFFFIPPKAKHLKAYEEWNDSPQQNYTFLPCITKECYRVDLSEGDTMLIPSGWIHAVWTPEDSLVIGGNFLNRLSYKNQFKVVEIEKANETPMKFRYPFFQKIMWYTAIKYLNEDPLPDAVRQLFYEGQQFQREIPIWGDFDGDVAGNDPRPGAHNARFYSQAELDGLPELVNFIFRTVMLVAGRVEGVSQDRMKRVNASIPKGFGEPLDVAKTFALWVAWKRGNEDPPAWAHPDAVLPSSKEEGPPKKLSERKLKELEKKEAIAAWRIAPDRQSARVMAKANATAAPNPSSNIPSNPPDHQFPPQHHQNQPGLPSHAAPSPAMMMSSASGQFLSTPKTSVLGPKRVACDACRKRRIRCKHKDMVMQASPGSGPQSNGDSSFQSQLAPELHENITLTPARQGFMSTVMDSSQQPSPYPVQHSQPNGNFTNGENHTNEISQVDGSSLINAYVTANIPMVMNGVHMVGDAPKRGRSKACYECRKSKRRCIHDENGNVDPVKASENPVPRGAVPAKKRPPEGEGSPSQQAKKQKTQQFSQVHFSQSPQMGMLMPEAAAKQYIDRQRMPQAPPRQKQQPASTPQQDHNPKIDPSLFSISLRDSNEQSSYGEQRYSYQTQQPSHSHGAQNWQQSQYQLPSLEQIANEVLVDMNGETQDQDFRAQHPELAQLVNGLRENNAVPVTNGDSAPMTNGDSAAPATEDLALMTRGDVNQAAAQNHSAVALPSTEVPEVNGTDSTPNAMKHDSKAQLPNGDSTASEALAHPSIETDTDTVHVAKILPQTTVTPLPLYQPPPPPSHSPEATRKPSVLTNGVHHDKSSSPPLKRKRDSNSAVPGSKAKKAREGDERGRSREASVPLEKPLSKADEQSLELAKLLQAEELGLRRRGSK